MTKQQHLDPSTRFVRSLDGEYFMVREAAEMLGVKHTLLRALLKEDTELGPSFCAYFGKVKIYLYTRDDISRIGNHLQARKQVFPNTDVAKIVGRPKKWSTEQRKDRQRLYSRAHYYQKRLKSQQDHDLDTSDTQQKLEQIEKQLEAMVPANG